MTLTAISDPGSLILRLTRTFADGKLDPVIGRDDEIRRSIQILSR